MVGFKSQCVPTTVAGLNERQPDAEKDDLKDALNTMESKIRRMRDQRSNHNKSAGDLQTRETQSRESTKN